MKRMTAVVEAVMAMMIGVMMIGVMTIAAVTSDATRIVIGAMTGTSVTTGGATMIDGGSRAPRCKNQNLGPLHLQHLWTSSTALMLHQR